MSQDPKGRMKLERTPDIPAMAGDGLAYGGACLQFLDLVWKFGFLLKENFTGYPSFSSDVKFC